MSSKLFADDPDHAYRKHLEATIYLIVDMIGKRKDSSPLLRTLVEHACRLQVARPIAVHYGILRVLLDWSISQDHNEVSAAQTCRKDLERDPYLKGWIEAEMAFLSVID